MSRKRKARFHKDQVVRRNGDLREIGGVGFYADNTVYYILLDGSGRPDYSEQFGESELRPLTAREAGCR